MRAHGGSDGIQVLAVYAVGFVEWARHARVLRTLAGKKQSDVGGESAQGPGGRKVGMGASEELLQPVNQTVAVTYQGNAVPMGSLDDVGRPAPGANPVSGDGPQRVGHRLDVRPQGLRGWCGDRQYSMSTRVGQRAGGRRLQNRVCVAAAQAKGTHRAQHCACPQQSRSVG